VSLVSGGSELTAIVLNWRTPELTARSAQALIADGVAAQRIVVVDNGSGQDNVARLQAALPDCPILTLPENRGFAAANNLAARELPAERAYLFVNSDAFVHRSGSVARLRAALEEPAAGVAVPRLLNENLSLQRNVYPRSTLVPEIIRAAGLSRTVPQRLAPQLGAHWNHSTAREIQSAIGAVLLVRALAWEQLRGFDERRFMYAEDLDLFWRLGHLGWRARFVPDAEFIHLGGASSSQRWDDPERAERVAAAEAEMLRAQLGLLRSSAVTGTMAAGAGLRALAYRLQGRTDAAASQKAWARGYRVRR
jgi:N-acetylglucosaminyl-diphospho-decaprenol L-rhamnosyltransferase